MMKLYEAMPQWKKLLPTATRFLLSLLVALIVVVALTLFLFAGHAAAPSYDGPSQFSTPSGYQTPGSS